MQSLRERIAAVRARTRALAAPLSEEDCCAQSMPDASPVKWHLAHTSWFFETFVLERFERGFVPFHPAFRVLFNSYYHGIGARHPRPERGFITRPSLREVNAYRSNVDERIATLLEYAQTDQLAQLLVLGLQHEQQHQELILTDLKHLLSRNPLLPAYERGPAALAPAQDTERQGASMEWQAFEGGVVHVGHRGSGFCFDNELPRHRQFVEPFALATRLVTNAEYRAFIDDGGYRRPELWLSDGWDWVQANALTQPLYWHRGEDGWQEFTLFGARRLDPQLAVSHVSFYEADAYARWFGARLPFEAEWEHAAQGCKDFGRFSLHTEIASGEGLQQLFGTCWQWTLSSYSPYPGYRPAAGSVGEYNGKFMCNQQVLRGSACVTPEGHARLSYRNFFPPSARWQFTGIRLARSV